MVPPLHSWHKNMRESPFETVVYYKNKSNKSCMQDNSQCTCITEIYFNISISLTNICLWHYIIHSWSEPADSALKMTSISVYSEFGTCRWAYAPQRPTLVFLSPFQVQRSLLPIVSSHVPNDPSPERQSTSSGHTAYRLLSIMVYNTNNNPSHIL